ncbi:hypothetical protein QW131_20855 [Roseibium salinum]|nr:hypothetical protein [Roseibium salinum]
MAAAKIALVTGAGKRVGWAIASGLAARGYALGLHYNSSAAGAGELCEEIRSSGGEAVLLKKTTSPHRRRRGRSSEKRRRRSAGPSACS